MEVLRKQLAKGDAKFHELQKKLEASQENERKLQREIQKMNNPVI